MAISSFRVKYPRPKKLSDPHSDFTPMLLDEILSTPDKQLYLRHYKNLLGPFLPAGKYEESVYFLPSAFRYLLTHEADALELGTSLIWFSSEYASKLEKDKLLDTVRDCIHELLDYWTRKFIVIHFDKAACREKGWGDYYFDYVENSEAVTQATADLVRFEKHADLAEKFIWDLALNDENDPIKAAWFLEYSRNRIRAAYRPPDYEPIQYLINDIDSLNRAAKVVTEKLILTEPSTTYWRDIFDKLNLRK